MRVLIVEDEGLIALSHEQLVIEAGYTPIGIAEDTASALRLAREAKPDVALLDMQLRDGPTGNVIARALQQEHGVQTIFVTANLGMVAPDVKAGCHALVPKPASDLTLLAALRDIARLIEIGRAA